MAALRSRCGHYIFALWFLSSFYLFYPLPNLSGRRLDVYHTSTHDCDLSANLECMSEMWYTRLAGNTERKNRRLRTNTIAKLCRAISSQLRRVSTIGKNCQTAVLLHMPLQYGELRPTNSWDPLATLGHPSKFQRVSRLGSVTARHSSSGRQPNFAALNRGRHLYSAGWPSRWALAHILVIFIFAFL